MRYGSLFAGYGGLELGVQSVLGGSTAWHCEIEPAPSRILAHHWPDIPNLGDITKVDWPTVEPVDVLTGGFPCQDVSHAGKRLGLKPGTRSGLWAHMAYAIDQLRPGLVVAENVRGLLSAEAGGDLEPCPWCVGDGEGGALRALGAVLGDLADLGYDAQWVGVRAADAGAPHGRFRVFVFAWPAADTDCSDARPVTGRTAGAVAGGWQPSRPRPESGRPAVGNAADADRLGHERAGSARGRRSGPADGGVAAADTAGHGRERDEGRPEPARIERRPDAAERGDAPAADAGGQRHGRVVHPGDVGRVDGEDAGRARQREVPGDRGATAPADPSGVGNADVEVGCDPAGQHERTVTRSGDRTRAGTTPARVRDMGGTSPVVAAWGDYEPAVRRWEHVLGRLAPAATEPGKNGQPRLSPAFVEWMMGLPAGHVTDPAIGLTRNEQLKALGNGVVIQQAALATRMWLATRTSEVAA